MHVGIDLGTTFSRSARLDARGAPLLIPDARAPGRLETPSVVHLVQEEALVGHAAADLGEETAERGVARHVKLKLGSDHPVLTDARGRGWPAEAVAALILRKLWRDAQAHADTPLEGAALAVPAHFADGQRRALWQAACLAGLPVRDLIEEPLAAAAHYGAHTAAAGSTFLVYGLGGGVCGAAVLRAEGQGLATLANEGLSDLDGKDFDEAVMALLAGQLRAAHGYDPLQDRAALAPLRRHAEALKIRVAASEAAPARATMLLGGRVLDVALTRGQFERLTLPLAERGLSLCETALQTAGVGWTALSQVLLFGGSTLLPAVAAGLRRASGLPEERFRRHLPQLAVVFGTALLAARREGWAPRPAGADLGFRVLDPTTRQPAVDVIIPRDSTVPVRKARIYYSNRADQRRMVFEVVQVRKAGCEPTSFGHFGFPLERPRKNHPLEVTLGYDELGLVTVEARDPDTGREVRQEFGEAALSGEERMRSQAELLRSVTMGD